MASRLELHETLCSILGSRCAYFQPPETIKMYYPAIVYKLNPTRVRYANDGKYTMLKNYQLMLIDKTPDSPLVDKLMELDYIQFDNQFISDNLYHYIFTIYY